MNIIKKYNNKCKPRFSFKYDGYDFKYVDEWTNGSAIYIDDKEIIRSRSLFSAPFISNNKMRGSFIGRDDRIINVRFELPQIPFISIVTVYFNSIVVFKKIFFEL